MTRPTNWLQSSAHPGSDVSSDVRTTMRFFNVMVAIGFAVIVIHSGFSLRTVTPILWALASFASGAAIGFLFGVPKILQPQTASASGTQDKGQSEAQQYRQQVNTNLTEISDWLTKIIVGLGLINLAVVPTHLVRVADVLAKGLSPDDVTRERPFALGIIVFFIILGFLFGYLSTRLFLAGAFWRADTESILSAQAQLSVEVASLQNSQGLLSASLTTQAAVQESHLQSTTQPQHGIDERLLEMANEYLTISASDWGERVRLKDDAAARMGDYVIKTGISRDLLAEEAARLPNEGLILALVTVINFAPQQGDLERILKVADKVKRLHVRYRTVLAFARLFRSQVAGPGDQETVDRILVRYSDGADASLSRLISATRLSIKPQNA